MVNLDFDELVDVVRSCWGDRNLVLGPWRGMSESDDAKLKGEQEKIWLVRQSEELATLLIIEGVVNLCSVTVRFGLVLRLEAVDSRAKQTDKL